MQLRRLLHSRRVWFALPALGFITLTAWLANNLVFGGRSQHLPDTPYTLVVQHGVPDDEVALVAEGLALADRYFASALGAQTGDPIRVRLARRSPCIPFQPLRNASTAVAELDGICVQTQGRVWRYAIREDPDLALSIIAHEHFHNLQGQLGCLPKPDAHTYRWLVEGSATFVGWQTLISAGRTTQARVEAEMREWGGFSGALKPLREYERVLPGDAEYALAHRAVELLAKRAESPAVLMTFCQQVRRGRGWHEAFRRAFGVTTDTFYKTFEQVRKADAGENQ